MNRDSFINKTIQKKVFNNTPLRQTIGMGTTHAIPLSVEAYKNYGDVIAAPEAHTFVPANMGTAKRFNFVAKLENFRERNAHGNLCIFRCTPQVCSPKTSFDVHLLEKHPHSTQIFIPLNARTSYLVIVCLGNTEPDLKTLKAFVAEASQGITYKPGTWHHPLIAMEKETDFACLVWEDGSDEDCVTFELKKPIHVETKADS